MTSTSNAGRTNKRVFSKLKQLKSPAYKSFHTLSVSITISFIKYIRNLCLPRNGSQTAICYHEKKTATTPKHYITPARFKFSMSLLKCIFFLRYPYLFKYSFISFVIICRIERLWRHEAKTKKLIKFLARSCCLIWRSKKVKKDKRRQRQKCCWC